MNKLKQEFKIMENTNSFTLHNNFVKELLEIDDLNGYELHLYFIENSKNEEFHDLLCKSFTKRNIEAAEYLYNKLFTLEVEYNLIADIIQILGEMKFYNLLTGLSYFIAHNSEVVRYKSIIVMGWLGNKNEVITLSDIMSSDELEHLRGFCGTAIRQIWFRHQELKDFIIDILLDKLKNEKSELVTALIILVLQDIYNQNFGLKENYKGEIRGNIKIARNKLSTFIKTKEVI